MINLVISSFQKRIARHFDINVGQEMIQGIESAKEIDAELVLADRNIQITFSRIWHQVGVWGKAKLLMEIMFSRFSDVKISEEELEKIKSQDMLDSVLKDFTAHFPRLKIPLIDERYQYLAQKIKDAPGNKIVAVLGVAHVPGIRNEILKEHDLEKLSQLPPKSKIVQIISWIIPVLIIALIIATFFTSPSGGVQQTINWVLWT